MRVLFCSTGINALGESFSQALFAKELISYGHQCYFIAPKLGAEYLLTFNFNEDAFLRLPNEKDIGSSFDINDNKDLFNKFVNKVKPDYIILADWHHYKPDGVANNNTYSLSWFDKNIPMGTFDHVGFAPQGRTVFQDEIKRLLHKSTLDNFQVKNFLPVQDRISFIIRPCPHHNNLIHAGDNIYNWAIFKDKFQRNGQSEIFLKKYNVKDGLIILNPIGMWQEHLIEHVFKRFNIKINYYADVYLPIIFNILHKIPKNIIFIVISVNVKKEEVIINKNITLIKRPPLKHELFVDNLLASDVFITDNLISSNLGKAVFANILPIVFKSTVYLDNNSSLASMFPLNKFILDKISVLIDNKIVFPFRSFPTGLQELEDMYKDNPFTNCFVEQELFDEESNIQLFEKLCITGEYRNNIINAQNNYIKDNKKLLPAEEILMNIN